MAMTTRQAVYLRFFMHANARHGGTLLHEWLLERARAEGIGGGSVFRAVAGFGRHGVLRETHFFELADDLPLKVEFIVDPAQCDTLLALVREAGADLVYTRNAVEFGIIEGRPA
ncbi:MAG TPA: DUF190 domain-containing protein [Rhodanobacteraceae bacterium]|nr:DUF190 domain-containing protein [Rhodanobacteraceae bacterium]